MNTLGFAMYLILVMLHAIPQLRKIRVDLVEQQQVPLLEEHGYSGRGLQLRRRDALEQRNDGNAAAPGGAQFGPHVGTVQGPGRQQHDQLMRMLEKPEDVFVEIRSRFDVGFVEEGLRAARLDFPRDLPRDPCVLRAMTHEHKAPIYRNDRKAHATILTVA